MNHTSYVVTHPTEDTEIDKYVMSVSPKGFFLSKDSWKDILQKQAAECNES